MSDSETPCFDASCACCRVYGERCRELEADVERLRAALTAEANYWAGRLRLAERIGALTEGEHAQTNLGRIRRALEEGQP